MSEAQVVDLQDAYDAMKQFADLYWIENERYRNALGLIRSKQDEAAKSDNALALKLTSIARKALEIKS